MAHFKAPTTLNVSDGIEEAVRQVLRAGAISPSDVSCVSIGTTAFINAVLEADAARLSKIAVIRLCGPYTRQCPPFIDFPKRLKTLIEGHIGYIDGGYESKCGDTLNLTSSRRASVDGREIASINEVQVTEQCRLIKERGLRNVSIKFSEALVTI